MISLHRAALVGALVLATLAPRPAQAQWDVLPYEPGFPVLEEGFLVVHENVDGIHAFSAVTRKWTRITEPGPTLIGTGDWVALARLFRPQGADLIGYSARRNRTATLSVVQVFDLRVEDDVIFAVASFEDGQVYACGFSGVTAAWDVQPLGFVPSNALIATSRFVAGVVDPGSRTLYGFAARTGIWAPFPQGLPVGIPDADGNTLTCPLVPAGVAPEMAAFSGVRGNWSVSPQYLFDFVNSPLLDHNVAYVRSVALGGFRGAAYSAYAGQWTVSPVTHSLLPSTGETISDNVVLISDENPFFPAPRFEAFGSRPSLWGQIFGNWGGEILDEDYVLIRSGSEPLIAGFSGLCSGLWVDQSVATEAVAIGIVGPDHIGVMDELGSAGALDRLWVFRPSSAQWAPPIELPPGSSAVITDHQVDFERLVPEDPPQHFSACTDRWGGWRATQAPDAIYDEIVGGSVIAHRVIASPDPATVGAIWIFDERCDRWQAPFDPGPNQPLSAERNLLVSWPDTSTTGRVWGYSVQRGDWSEAVGAVSPLTVEPQLEENVAWFVEGGDEPRLWAFGSPNVGHVDYQWPNGTEYHTSADPDPPIPIPGPLIAYTVLGVPGLTQALTLLSAGVDCDGVVLPGIAGELCLTDPVIPATPFLPVTDPDCLTELFATLDSPVSPCLMIWLQPLTADFAVPELRFDHRCDPAWIF